MTSAERAELKRRIDKAVRASCSKLPGNPKRLPQVTDCWWVPAIPKAAARYHYSY